MSYLITGGGLAFVLFLLQVLRMLARQRISKKAHADYARSLGTLHARQLRAGIKRHEAAMSSLVLEQERISAAIDALAREEVKQLRRALAEHLVRGPLAQVRGIGPKLRDRIVETCFTGSLESLKEAQQVAGVGVEMAGDIQAWVQQTQSRLPQLLKEDFPGKEEILLAVGQRRDELTKQRALLDQTLKVRRAVLLEASEKLATLELVTPTTYRRALQGDSEAAERVAAHTLGAYPEWGTAPAWYAVVTSQPDRDLHEI